jgi:hypothetical protein
VTSVYVVEGQHNELADFGYNQDGKKGKKQLMVDSGPMPRANR